jgi:hypothetical protein
MTTQTFGWIGGAGGVISKGERPAAVVVNTNEEWMIACDTAELAGLTRSAVTFAATGVTPALMVHIKKTHQWVVGARASA